MSPLENLLRDLRALGGVHCLGSQGQRPPTLLSNLLYAGGLLFFSVAYFRVHQLASYNFPVPWVDEADILWRAIAFAKTGSLHALEITPSYQLYNRVPGYLIFMGSLFTLCGFSLQFARMVSCVLVIASFLLLAWMTARYRFRHLSLFILGVFLLSKTFVVTGNNGRMEALLLFVVCLGFLLLQGQRDREALAVLLLAPLIHPNGVYFLISCGVYLVGARLLGVTGRPLGRRDAAFVVVSVGLWCIYAVYVGFHWQEHQHQMMFQFRIKLARDISANLFTQSNIMLMIATLLCGVYSLTQRLKVGFLLVLAIPAWLAFGIGIEMWYQVFNYLFYALFSIVTVQVIAHLVDRLIASVVPPIKYVVATALTAVLVLWNYQAGRLEGPFNYPWSLGWGHMNLRNDVSYINEADVAAVGGFLDSLRSPARTLQVRFFPEGDALLFESWEGRGLRFSMYGIDTAGDEVVIMHTSRALPSWLRQEVEQRRASAKLRPLRQRDQTEAWYYQPPTAKPG